MLKSQTFKTVLVTSAFWIAFAAIIVFCLQLQVRAYNRGLTEGMKQAKALQVQAPSKP